VRSDMLVGKLRDLLETHEMEWSSLWKLQFWVLYMGAVETQSVDDRMWFAQEIAIILDKGGIREWKKGLGCVKEIVWVESIFCGRDVDLGADVDRLLMEMI
jgi:hypothetical protein